ncbi:MAG: right-handed parallel beta-helix repeat-containing protein [Sporocytophaga sp.]|uniref:PKD domain-containing protein n=1 Tax=Sporocytophaga sp. TaxID=2231183 RepID=UPI001B2515CA|nr:PKD domain-containing protein [Sporocytophaga sp.]MBO9703662.1 right-handed parallel beta-helix repeat-containing protein [Sporocytophaga sp.]
MIRLFKLLFVLVAFIFFSEKSSQAQCLSGTFSIGGSGSSFVSFKASVEALKERGVCGPVAFYVNSGVYNECISIPFIPGVTAENTVKFISSTRNSSDVIIQNPSSNLSESNYAIQFDSASYISIENITIKRTAYNPYSNVIDIRNGSNNISLSNNVISSEVFGNTENGGLIFSPASNDSYISITGNTFKGGQVAINLRGASQSSYEKELTIKNNTFDGQYKYATYLSYQSNLNFSGNTILTNYYSGDYFGIAVSNCYGIMTIQNNRLSNGGITLNNCIQSAENPALIVNNMIRLAGNYSNALYLSNCSNLNILFNTFQSSMGMYLNGGTNIRFKNNIIICTNYAIQLATPSALVECDYNNLKVAGTNIFASFEGRNFADFRIWKLSSGKDQNSISLSPKFFPKGELHIDNDIDMDGKGVYDSHVPLDIDGEVRDLTNPDIGADEYQPLPDNIGITSVLDLDKPVCSGNIPLKIAIRNFGSNKITSFKLSWEKNKVVQPTYNWSGSLERGEYDTLVIDRSLFELDSSYTVRFWLSFPNGSVDTYTSNDSSASIKVFTKMQGTYTLGGYKPSYKTFTSAYTDLQNRGVCGPVTFIVRDGSYREAHSLNYIEGTSVNNLVTFQSESRDSSLVKLTAIDQFSPCLKLTNTSNITFNQISFQSRGGAIYFKDCQNIRFQNSKIEPGISGEGINDNIYIINNYFPSGGIGISAKRVSILSNQFDNGIMRIDAERAVVSKNSVNISKTYNQYDGGIRILNSDSSVVSNNRVLIGTGLAGIMLEGIGHTYVTNNFIRIGLNTESYGIYTSAVENKSILFNTIHLTTTETQNSSVVYFKYNTSVIQLKNNILYNAGGGTVIKTYGSLIYFTSDYNNLYTTGTKLVNEYKSLAIWRSEWNQDLHSVSSLPSFVAINDLHSLFNADIAGKGISIPEIKYDIDGEPRKKVPDIGADEFSGMLYDASLEIVNKPSAGCHGSKDIYIKIKNNSSDTLRRVLLNWQVDSYNQTPKEWIGKIAPGATSGLVKLGEYLFDYDLLSSLKVWSNFDGDLNHSNDMVKTTSFYERMGGTYFIGGPKSDFNSITSALEAVTKMGVCAPVVFRLRDGVYEEIVNVYPIPGTSPVNTVTFTSDKGDSSKVIWKIYSPVILNSNLTINGAANLIFSKLSFIQEGSTSIVLNQGCENIKFISNYIERDIEAEESVDYLVLRNNFLKDGMIYLRGVSDAMRAKGNKIEGNKFSGARISRIVLYYQDALTISDNVFLKDAAYSTNAIQISYSGPSISILNNKIGGIFSCCGPGNYEAALLLESCSGLSSNPIKVYNNFISSNGVPGIYNLNSSYVNYFHNSISVKGGDAFYIQKGSNLKIENNILSTNNGGIALNIFEVKSLISDYNNLHTDGSLILAKVYSQVEAWNLSDWQKTGYDLHSFNTNPMFMARTSGYSDFTDLHINRNNLSPVRVPNPIAGLSRDIEGDIRDASNPMVGADEYVPNLNNAQAIKFELPTTLPCEGVNDILLSIANYGFNNLTSVTIKWTIDGVPQIPFRWKGSLNSSGTEVVNIGKYNFGKGGIVKLQAWTENPNGVNDTFTISDTTVVTLTPTALSGTYTIGNSGSDYKSFTDAVNDLKFRGICGPVIFNVKPGTYNEKIRIPEIRGTNVINTIVFQPENNDSTSVTLTRDHNDFSTTDADYLIFLDGADYISFKRMNLKSTLGSYCRVIYITGEANYINFSNNIIESSLTDNNFFAYNDVVYIGADNQVNPYNNYISFTNNTIIGGSTGINYTGGSNGEYTRGLIISNNSFINQSSSGLTIEHTISPVITKNKFDVKGGFTGANISDTRDRLIFSENVINFESKLSRSYYYVLSIRSHKSYSAVSAGLVVNNMINVKNFLDYDMNVPASVLYTEDNKYLNFLYNSVNLNNGNPESDIAVFYSNKDSSLVVENNIFCNRYGGYTMNINQSIVSSNYNDLYTTGSKLVKINSKDYTDIATYAGATQNDLNSLSLDPQFLNDLSDLHLSISSPAIGMGIVNKEVSIDIDGDYRSSKPSIGADESLGHFNTNVGLISINSPLKSDYCKGLKEINVSVKNYGNLVIDDFILNWEVNGIAESPFNWSGSLKKDSIVSLNLGNYNFGLSGTYNLKVYLSLPGSMADDFPYNDTISYDFIYSAPAIASFKYVLRNDSIFINNTSQSVKTYSWSFGDGSHGSDKNPVYYYPYSGEYVITLKVSNKCNDDSYSDKVTINLSRDLSLDSIYVPGDSYCSETIGSSIVVKNVSTEVVKSFSIISDELNSETIDWHGTLLPNDHVKVNFNLTTSRPGYHNVSYRVVNPNGQIDQNILNDTASVQLYWLGAPVANFNYSIEDGSVFFANHSRGAESYVWNFGDNSSLDYTKDPSHTYLADGIFTVSLEVRNECDTSEITKSVEIINTSIQSPAYLQPRINVYPNPAQDFVNINTFGDLVSGLKIMTIDGLIVYNMDQVADESLEKIDLTDFTSGMYFVEVRCSGYSRIFKLFIEK